MSIELYVFLCRFCSFQFLSFLIDFLFFIGFVKFKIIDRVPFKSSLVVSLFHQVLLLFICFVYLRGKHVFQNIFISLCTIFNLNTLSLGIFNTVIKMFIKFLILLQLILPYQIFIHFLYVILLSYFFLTFLFYLVGFSTFSILCFFFIILILAHQSLDIFTSSAYVALLIELFEHFLDVLFNFLILLDFVIRDVAAILSFLHFIMEKFVIVGFQSVYLLGKRTVQRNFVVLKLSGIFFNLLIVSHVTFHLVLDGTDLFLLGEGQHIEHTVLPKLNQLQNLLAHTHHLALTFQVVLTNLIKNTGDISLDHFMMVQDLLQFQLLLGVQQWFIVQL